MIKHIDYDKCTNCGSCAEVCPMDVFRMDDGSNRAFIKYLRDCQSCFICERICPEGAIYCMPSFERRIPDPW